MWRWIIGAALIAAIAFYTFFPTFNTANTPLLVVDMKNEEILPRNFRILKDLQASGSAQFSELSLQKIRNILINNHTTIVDLRQESHGFLNGNAVSWYTDNNWANKGKSLELIQEDEHRRLQQALNQKIILIYFSRKFPYPLYVKDAATEQLLTSSSGMGYKRLPVLDHTKPSDSIVDDFVDFIKHLSKNTWLHFHCAAGEGRTTTFLAMYDMMHNAQSATWESIIEKQKNAGGINLLHLPNDWKHSLAVDRARFLKRFYEYCQQNPQFQIPWSTWSAQAAQAAVVSSQ